jgi:tryptophan synthase alpha chain
MIERALITYITAGDPDKVATLEFLLSMEKYADVIELGIPFSDPMADGKTIQEANFRALKNGFRMKDVFEIVRSFRDHSEKPLILMSYYNPVYRMGFERFFNKARSSGVSATIIVDLPFDEAEEYISLSEKYGIERVFLSAPNTPEERLRRVDELSSFIYLISLYGVTGVRRELSPLALEALKRVKRICRKPVAVGFGISTKEHVRELLKHGADGVVVGSAIVELIGKYGREASPFIEKRLRELRRGLKV